MIPVLYPPNAADFSSFGLGVLTAPFPAKSQRSETVCSSACSNTR